MAQQQAAHIKAAEQQAAQQQTADQQAMAQQHVKMEQLAAEQLAAQQLAVAQQQVKVEQVKAQQQVKVEQVKAQQQAAELANWRLSVKKLKAEQLDELKIAQESANKKLKEKQKAAEEKATEEQLQLESKFNKIMSEHSEAVDYVSSLHDKIVENGGKFKLLARLGSELQVPKPECLKKMTMANILKADPRFRLSSDKTMVCLASVSEDLELWADVEDENEEDENKGKENEGKVYEGEVYYVAKKVGFGDQHLYIKFKADDFPELVEAIKSREKERENFEDYKGVKYCKNLIAFKNDSPDFDKIGQYKKVKFYVGEDEFGNVLATDVILA